MQESWANSGVDLLLDLRGARGRAAVESALRDAVRGGRLVAGTVLPSSRALAAELGLARNTVADAYGQLVAEGWLTARQGSGTRVGERATPQHRPSSPRRPPPASRLRYNLRPGVPDLAGFPRTAWLAAARRALAATPNDLFGYPDPRGHLGLRETLASYLARVRGVRATPDQVLICSGFVQALSLLASTLRAGGARTLAMESHGLGLHRELARAASSSGVVGGADVGDVLLEDPVVRRVGDHRARPAGRGTSRSRPQVVEVDRAVLARPSRPPPSCRPSPRRRRWCRARRRDQADVAARSPLAAVVAADREQPGQLALRAGVRLDRHPS